MAIGAPALPMHVASRIAMAGAEPERADVSFWEFLTLEEYDRPRPNSEGLADSTARWYRDRIRQVGREVVGNEAAFLDSPPPWEQILKWRDSPEKGGKARLEPHRKALQWLAAYWGQGGPSSPHFLRESWMTAKAVARAREAGTMRRMGGFFALPMAIEACLASRPHERVLGTTAKFWNRLDQREIARYKDQLFRTWLFLGLYTGPRPGEFATLRLQDYQPERGGIFGWRQPKKHMRERDAAIPEEFVWRSHTDPSIDHYLRYVRPRVAKTQPKPGDPLFVTSNGKAWTPAMAQRFLQYGLTAVLGAGTPRGHGLPRACATWRRHHGWSVAEIAALLDDSERIVERAYFDQSWLRAVGIQKTNRAHPRCPRVRSNGRSAVEGAISNPTGELARGMKDGPVRI